MESNDIQSQLSELDELKARVAALESEIAAPPRQVAWVPRECYTTYHLLAGVVLGLVAAHCLMIARWTSKLIRRIRDSAEQSILGLA